MSKIANELRFLIAEKEREKITIQQMKKIKKLYEQTAKDFANNYKMLKGRDNISSILRRQYIDEMQKDLNVEITKISKQVEKGIEGAILQTSESVVRDNQRLLSNMGFNIKKAFSYVPTDVVETITSGQLYQSDWTLSKAIWGDKKKTISDIHEVIAKGLIENKGSYDIAKDLEKYVDPNVAKDWDWSKVYPNTKRKVEYNAQRLARTLTSHAYQESFVRATQVNPFINAYKWETSNSHTTCDLCIDRATQDKYGLGAGIFPKDSLPLDHPNGKCIVVSVLAGSMSDISDQIADWYKSPEGTFPDIDAFADNLYGLSNKVKTGASRATKKVPKTGNIVTGKEKAIKKFNQKDYGSLTKEEVIEKMSEYYGGEISASALPEVYRSYVGTGQSFVINNFMYSGDYKLFKSGELVNGMTTHLASLVDNFKDYVSKAPNLHKNVKLVRFVDGDAVQGMLDLVLNNEEESYKLVNLITNAAKDGKGNVKELVEEFTARVTGVQFEANSFISTSHDITANILKGRRFKLEIFADEGTDVLMTYNHFESEVILNAGTKLEFLDLEVLEDKAVLRMRAFSK